MDSNDGEIIHKFYDRIPDHLIPKIKIQKVLKVIKNTVIFKKYSEFINNYETSNCLTNVKNESLLKDIIRNENGYKDFIHILLHTAQDNIALEIEPSVKDLCDITQCDPKSSYKEIFSFDDKNPKEILENPGRELSMSLSGGIYPMFSSPRGLCYLINNYFTVGTYKEMKRLRNIFYQLHFDVKMEKNLSIGELTELMRRVSKNPDLSNHNAFMFMIITPGNDNKQIFDSDNNQIAVSKLVELFDDNNSPDLKEKPRLFFFNCCQIKDPEEIAEPAEDIQKSAISLSQPNDVFICFSTLDNEYYYSNAYIQLIQEIVDWNDGTQFGKAFADSLFKKAYYKELNSIIIRTNHLLKEIDPKPFDWTILKKNIYFNPSKPQTLTISTINNTQQTLENFMIHGLGKSLDEKYLIEILEKICKSLKRLHNEGVIHEHINPNDIYISIPNDIGQRKPILVEDINNIRIQLRDKTKIGLLKQENFCWKSPEVLEALDNEYFEVKKENDIFSLGCVIYYVLTRGQHPFDYKVGNIFKGEINLNGLSGDRNQVYIDLIERMLKNIMTDRPSVKSVLIHPMFWKPEKIMTFYYDIKTFLYATNGSKTFMHKQKDILKTLEDNRSVIYSNENDWLKKLDSNIQIIEQNKIDNKLAFKIKDKASIQELLNYIRNKYTHRDQCEAELKNVYGVTADSYSAYFGKTFPHLLIITYNAMEGLKDENDLKKYYSM